MRWLDGNHQLNGHEFEETLGDSEGQGSLACCSPWGRKESDTSERLNNRKKEHASNIKIQTENKKRKSCTMQTLIKGKQ